MTRLFLTILLLIAIAGPAQTAVGPERTIPTASGAATTLTGLVYTSSGFLLAWGEHSTDVTGVNRTQLSVQTIDGRGELLGPPIRFPGVNFSGLGSDGTSALLVWSEGKLLRAAWVGDRWASEPFLVAEGSDDITSINVAGYQGRFAIGWVETGRAVHLATIGAREVSIEGRTQIYSSNAANIQLAAGPSHLMVQWDERQTFPDSGCSSSTTTAFATWALITSPNQNFSACSGARGIVTLKKSGFLAATAHEEGGRFVLASGSGGETASATRGSAIPLALAGWRGNVAILWSIGPMPGSPAGTFVSFESGVIPADEPPPAFRISNEPHSEGRLASSELLLVAAFADWNPLTNSSRLVYHTITADQDLSALPARPDPPFIAAQTSGRDTVDVVLHGAGGTIEITPLDNPAAKTRTLRGSQTVVTLAGDTLYSFRTFAGNEKGIVSSSAVTLRTIAAFNPRAPLWQRTTDNQNGTWTIEWSDLSSNETAFRILLVTDGNQTVLAQVPPNSTRATIAAPSVGRIAIAVMNGSQAILEGTGAVTPLQKTIRRRGARP